MPFQQRITPNAAMLFPRPQLVDLAGKPFRLLQLRVSTIAHIEEEVESLAESPFNPEYLESIRFLEATQNDIDNHRVARVHHFYKVWEAQEDWPPSFSGQNYAKTMATDVGRMTFLAVMIRRSNRNVSFDTIVELAEEMSAECWEKVDRIAWGVPDWMAFGYSSDTPKESRPGRGINWAKTIESLAVNRGYTYDNIGRMFINQVVNALNEGEPQTVWINDPPEPKGMPLHANNG